MRKSGSLWRRYSSTRSHTVASHREKTDGIKINKINKTKSIAGNIKKPLPILDRTTGEKSSKDTEELITPVISRIWHL